MVQSVEGLIEQKAPRKRGSTPSCLLGAARTSVSHSCTGIHTGSSPGSHTFRLRLNYARVLLQLQGSPGLQLADHGTS